VRGQYTCIGDAYASVVLTSLFARRGKLYQMRYGADLIRCAMAPISASAT